MNDEIQFHSRHPMTYLFRTISWLPRLVGKPSMLEVHLAETRVVLATARNLDPELESMYRDMLDHTKRHGFEVGTYIVGEEIESDGGSDDGTMHGIERDLDELDIIMLRNIALRRKGGILIVSSLASGMIDGDTCEEHVVMFWVYGNNVYTVNEKAAECHPHLSRSEDDICPPEEVRQLTEKYLARLRKLTG